MYALFWTSLLDINNNNNININNIGQYLYSVIEIFIK